MFATGHASRNNMRLYDHIYALSEHFHKGQFRKNGKTPYFEHPKAIVAELYKLKHLFSEEDFEILLSLGIAHDLIEDCDITFDEFRAKIAPFGTSYQIPVLMKALVAITKVGKPEYMTYLKGVKEDRFALIVKLEDIKHNMSDLERGTLRDKYALAIYYLTN